MKLNYKEKNKLFLKSLIDSDFLILDQKTPQQLRYLKGFYKEKCSSLTFLDPLETIKMVKQFIRMLQFLKNQKSNFLHILVENKQHLELAETFLQSSNIKMPFLVKETLPNNNVSSSTVQLLILLSFSLDNKETYFKRIFDRNIFLINKINAKVEKNNWGTYKIYNDLNDFKKFVFFLIVLNQTLTTKL